MEQQENILLTDEQIEDKALEIYPIINDNTDPTYKKYDILFQHREIYKDTWKECTEHYRELIEAGIKWRELVTHCEGLSTLWYGKKRTDEETIDLMTSVINKVTELQDRK